MSAYQTMLTRIWEEYKGLTLYELMFKANYALLKGEEIKAEDQQYIVTQFLSGIADESIGKSFCIGVQAPKEEKENGRQMYPIFYIPPSDNGKKYVTISTVTPHTQILSANSYELEILRLLAIFEKDSHIVKRMLEKTKSRLRTTCYGNFCETGECFETSLVVLRFINTAFPSEIQWMKKLMEGISIHLSDKKRHSGVSFYYWLTLSELPISLAKPEIQRLSMDMQKIIKKSFVMNSSHDKYASPFALYVLRNCLARLDEFTYIKYKNPNISKKDGRIHFDMQDTVFKQNFCSEQCTFL